MSLKGWTVHGDGKKIAPGAVVAPEERLSWGRTIGIGMQHVVAMFGATLLVPTLTFAFIAPLSASQQYGIAAQAGSILVTGLVLAAVGVAVKIAGRRVLDSVMPPAVTGAIVALIGLNLAPNAAENFASQPLVAAVTLLVILLATVAGRGMVSRLSILLGVVAGWVFAALTGNLGDDAVAAIDAAPWVGLPEFHAPSFNISAIAVALPVLVVLVAENVGHVKAVSEMTKRDLDDLAGDALIADGLASTLAGGFGGSGTTTYAENIGVMAATRVYSTAAYWVAAFTAILLAFVPKFGALIFTIPTGVLGGACIVLYGLIGMLGVRIWMDNKVNFNNPVNLTAAAVALIAGIGNLTLTVGGVSLEGIAWGSVGIIVAYPIMKKLYDSVGEGHSAKY